MTATNTESNLTPVERCKLENLTLVIREKKRVFVEVGRALMQIRDERLYREQYSSFEDFCRAEFDFDRTYASRPIKAAKTDELLPIGNKVPNEAIARELGRLPEDERAEVWEQATTLAKPDEPTAQLVRRIVDNRLNVVDAPVRPVETDVDWNNGESESTEFDDQLPIGNKEKPITWQPQDSTAEQFARNVIDQHRVEIDRIIDGCPISVRDEVFEAFDGHVASMCEAWYSRTEQNDSPVA